MGVRLPRTKKRHWLASIAYKLNRFLPFSQDRKLDFLLDLEWVAHRLSHENASALNLTHSDDNAFLKRRIRPSDRVLEIGCSAGRVISEVDASERVGVDYDQSAIQVARSLHPRVTFIAGEAREFLERAKPFDVLILSHVLEHIDDPEEFLASISQRFGRIYVEVPDFEWSSSNQLRLARNRRLIYTDNDHVAEFDRAEMEAMFESLGLKVEDKEFRFGVMRYWVSSDASDQRCAT